MSHPFLHAAAASSTEALGVDKTYDYEITGSGARPLFSRTRRSGRGEFGDFEYGEEFKARWREALALVDTLPESPVRGIGYA
jgi:hypothetical protein